MKLSQLPFFQHVNWQPDTLVLREFARAMFLGFAVLGLLAAWKHHHFGTATFVLWAVGTGLALGALLPGAGRPVYLLVNVPTSFIGYFVSHVILFLIFFLVFTPLALILRATGKDLLLLRPSTSGSLWIHRSASVERESCYRQF